MRFRRIRQVKRRQKLRVIAIVSLCFFVGVLIGWTQNSGSNSSQRIVADGSLAFRPNDASYADNIEVLGRRKLSIKANKVVPPFSRLPAKYEKIVLPPRTPAKEFPLEPHTVIERNRTKEKGRFHYFMLFIVKSSPLHTARRDVIRKTWGAVKVVDGLLLNTIFVVGNVGENRPIQDMLAKENGIYGDILQTDTPEGYRNLPSKVLASMQWLVSKSSDISSQFYTFTDDDCIMNIANIVDFFGELPFIDKANEPSQVKNSSRAPSSAKEIQSIELHEKKIVNEVTLAFTDDVLERKGKFNTVLADDSPRLEPSKFSESDSDLSENLEIYAEMGPNAKIQIKRAENEDENEISENRGDIPQNFQFEPISSDIDLGSFNLAYRHNAVNSPNYLKRALDRSDDPGSIFHSRRLKPDAIYCGFAYDPKGRPHRRMRDKWGVTLEQYSGDSYPAFCHGGMYTMSGMRMTSIIAISTVTDWSSFHLEDVLVTGILREKTGDTESKLIRRGTDPKLKPLMYYVWDSGPRVVLKMSRKWKFVARELLAKRFVMEGIRNGKTVLWNNYGRSAR